jgi:hypothetical protein
MANTEWAHVSAETARANSALLLLPGGKLKFAVYKSEVAVRLQNFGIKFTTIATYSRPGRFVNAMETKATVQSFEPCPKFVISSVKSFGCSTFAIQRPVYVNQRIITGISPCSIQSLSGV